jgi:hypothetical protein
MRVARDKIVRSPRLDYLTLGMPALWRRVVNSQLPLVAGQRPSSLTGADSHASVCSAISNASSTSMPRYRTMLSNFV